MTKYRPTPVIAVDIGCTRAHVGLVDVSRRRCLFRRDFPSTKISSSLPDILDGTNAIARNFCRVPVIIAGGRGIRASEVEKAFRSRGAASVSHVKYHKALPLPVRYAKPATLGADRIADALYAATVYPGRNVIIIDSGTAITVDLVTKCGGFSGGAILAGVDAQLRMLHSSTGILPFVSVSSRTTKLPGSSTESCMRAGTVYGIAGAMNLLVRRYQKSVDGKCIVLATGGAWHVTERLVDFEFVAVPDMTIIGTALYR